MTGSGAAFWPQVLGQDRSLRFRAHRQRVLDLLAAGREDDALACAERDLGEAASADPSRCADVEAVMAAWVDADGGKGAAAAHRSDTADALNWALLGARGVGRGAVPGAMWLSAQGATTHPHTQLDTHTHTHPYTCRGPTQRTRCRWRWVQRRPRGGR